MPLSLNHGLIKLVIPFYGRWPSYIDFYLNSLANNPILSVTFITDLPVPSCNIPSNCSFYFLDFLSLPELILSKIGMMCPLNYPYKLCDLKPAYGQIFSDII